MTMKTLLRARSLFPGHHVDFLIELDIEPGNQLFTRLQTGKESRHHLEVTAPISRENFLDLSKKRKRVHNYSRV
jgi:hypothetical protein